VNDLSSVSPAKPSGSAARWILPSVVALALVCGVASTVDQYARAGQASRVVAASAEIVECGACKSARPFHERYPLAADAAVAEQPATF